MSIIQGAAHTSAGGYNIERSLRFNSADSAYLNRTPASAGNRKTWTWSGWVKRSVLGSTQVLFVGGQDTNNYTNIYLHGTVTDAVEVFQATGGSTVGYYYTVSSFRDPSAWYHIVVVCDTTNAGNKITIYVNNVAQTLTAPNTLSLNADTWINSANEHRIGRNQSANTNYFNGYITEVNFIDGQALTPSSFGETDSATGVWKPKKYSSTYGTNGFFLKFADNSGTTSTTLGKDSSGNGNNWTPNNFSVTAGSGNDSLVDTPTPYGSDTGVGGEVRGNYATLNPLRQGSASSATNGNLDFTSTSAVGSGFQSQITATFGIPASGKWYFECTPTTLGTSIYIGVVSDTQSMNTNPFSGTLMRTYVSSNGNKSTGSASSAYGNTYTTNDVIGVAVDMDTGSIFFYKNGTVQNSGTAAYTDLTGTTWVPYCVAGSSGATNNGNFNFGQRPFAYTAPSGFKALCTQNLPTPTIGATSTTQADNYFNAVLYTGNSSTQSITGVGFQPDLVWTKGRSQIRNNVLYDSVRGTLKQLYSNQTAAELSVASSLTSFDTDGFSLGGDSESNWSSSTYVAWNWNAGGSNATNTSGTITSTVRANTTAGFSIVTYDSNPTGTVGHGLGVTPKIIIEKKRDVTSDWLFSHSLVDGSWDYLRLNLTNANANAVVAAPTSTVFTPNASGDSMIAYCFAEVAGYSKFGSYTGNGSTDGPFVYTGFRPRYVLVKRTDSTGSWPIVDTARDTYNATDKGLIANLSDAEGTGYTLDYLSNGFKLRLSGTAYNASGGTYIYAAFASNPFKYSLAA